MDSNQGTFESPHGIPQDTAVLTLKLFGVMSVTLEHLGRLETLALTPRLAELLAFLAIGRGRFFSRTDIARSIWETEEDCSVGSVNTALWRLRRSIERAPLAAGDFVITTPGGAIGLNGPCRVVLDTGHFEEHARPGLAKPTEKMTVADVQALQQALKLYRDDSLNEFRTSWALRERERLRNVYVDSAAKLMQMAEAGNRYAEAVAYGGLILAVDLPREDIHRRVMRLLADGGRRALAMRQFEICRSALHTELGIPPMPETVELYKRIAAGSYPVAKPSAASALVDQTTDVHDNPAHRIYTIRDLLAEADKHLRESLEHLPR
jgi:DNA-binding SARP family transcriptional activator